MEKLVFYNQSAQRLGLILLFLIASLVFIVLGLKFAVPNRFSHVSGTHDLVADYDNFLFVAYGDEISCIESTATFTVNHVSHGQSQIYTSFNQETRELRNVTESWIRKIIDLTHWQSVERENYRSYFNERSYIQFKEGRLSKFKFVENDLDFVFGPSSSGPFVSLPMTRSRMIEVFGKPKRWRWAKRHGV